MTGLYLHIPFCVHKCFYCDFYSKTDLSGFGDFTDSLLKEIDLRADLEPSKPVIDTIFLGGGTPSLLPVNLTELIFNKIFDRFDVQKDSEITMECNPGTVSQSILENYRRIGINRLSFGVQSFDTGELKFLERIHSNDEAVESVKSARKAEFDNISIDLIFSIPGQTKERLINTLNKAVDLEPDHISYYSLIYEPGTPLYKQFLAGKILKVDSETDASNYEMIIDFLTAHGYQQYEVSNFTSNGKKCRHNLHYWHGQEYFGFGPSAHGYLRNERYWNFRNLNKYNKLLQGNQVPTKGSELLSPKNRFEELIFLGLRADGINLNQIDCEFGIEAVIKLMNEIKRFKDDNFFNMKNDIISLTKKGYMVCDDISLKILAGLDKSLC